MSDEGFPISPKELEPNYVQLGVDVEQTATVEGFDPNTPVAPNAIGGLAPVVPSDSSVVAPHTHNGTDSPRLNSISIGNGSNSYNLDPNQGMWMGADTFASAPFSVSLAGALVATSATISGSITATTGAIGGFDIGADYIRDVGNSMGLASTVTGSDDVRFWAGDTYANRATAPFRVYESGAVVATSATITGSITVTSGSIGGFDIGADYIRDAADSFGLASTVTGGDDVRFWAGAAYASRATAPFRVTEAGAVTASSITITGGSMSGTPISSIPNSTATDISLLEKSHDIVFSVTDSDTVAWTAGTVVMSNGRTFSISSGNTGNMAALTYIYLDTAISSTVLQTTTTYSTAIGANKMLIGVANAGTTTASFIPYGPGSALINGDLIGALSIVSANVAASAITTTKIAALAVETGNLAANAVTTAKIAALAVTTAELAASAVTTAKIAADAVTSAEIAAGAVGSNEIAAGAIIAGKITAGTIVSADIAAGTITGGNIAATTITASNIAALTITASEIAASTITGAKIAATTITAANIAASTITSTEIAAGTITAANIAALTITASEIAANTITAAKIAASTITTTEIAANTIVAGNIAASTITAAKMNVSQLSAIAADLGAITAGTVTLTSSGHIKSGQSAYNTGTGFWLGIDGVTPKFSIGNPSGRYLTWDGSDLVINGYVQSGKGAFGGDGSDGALSISSGTTTIDLAGASFVQKNYTSISITGTGALAFSNPHANGTKIVLRSQGGVTITTSATRAIDLRSLGAGAGSQYSDIIESTRATYGVAGAGGTGGGADPGDGGLQYGASGLYPFTLGRLSNKVLAVAPGSGGGNGSGNASSSGAGGRGAGALYIECNGALNITGTIDASGAAGSDGAGGADRGGGGGGGGGGMILILYNTLTANSGTYTVTGGAGGAMGSGGGTSTGTGGGGAGGLNGPGGTGGYVSGGTAAAGSNGLTGASGGAAGGGAGESAGGGGTAGEYFVAQNTSFA